MRLGELIRALTPMDPTWQVYYDFCGCMPKGIGSWRGVYAELALGWTTRDEGPTITVAELLPLLKGAIGKIYHGYKGGDFKMDESTDVHVDNYSEWTSTELVAVSSTGYSVILRTQREAE